METRLVFFHAHAILLLKEIALCLVLFYPGEGNNKSSISYDSLD